MGIVAATVFLARTQRDVRGRVIKSWYTNCCVVVCMILLVVMNVAGKIKVHTLRVVIIIIIVIAIVILYYCRLKAYVYVCVRFGYILQGGRHGRVVFLVQVCVLH